MLLERLVTSFSEDSVVALANLVRQREQESEVGPIAVIAQDDATFDQACQFARVAELVRPIRVFREWHEGRRWIDAISADRATLRRTTVAVFLVPIQLCFDARANI